MPIMLTKRTNTTAVQENSIEQIQNEEKNYVRYAPNGKIAFRPLLRRY